MKYLLLIMIMTNGQREQVEVPSLKECQKQARVITQDKRRDSTVVFVSPNGQTMAVCRATK